MTISDYLKEIQSGNKQSWTASQMGLSQSYFCNLINGRQKPDLQGLKKISKYTGRTIDDLVNTYGL